MRGLMDCKDCSNKCNYDLTDREVEKLWEELEDVTCIEAKDFYKDVEDYKDDISLVIMSDWQGFSAGTDTETIWHWFDKHHSKGVGWLMNEYESKPYCEMDNTEIRKITYENCPLKCTSCEALCNEMSVGQCRKNLSNKFDKG